MPTYQYECDGCQHAFEILQSMLDDKLKTCPKCGQDTLHRLIGAGSGIIFKGTGFYETDYKKKASAGASSTGNKPAAGESGSEIKSDTKVESKDTTGAKAEPKV